MTPICEICWQLTKTPELRHCCHSGVFIANFEQISKIAVMFPHLLLTSKYWTSNKVIKV